MADSEIFDRSLRRLRRDRAAAMPHTTPVLNYVCDDLLDRINDLKPDLAAALVVNGAAKPLITALQSRCEDVVITDPGAHFASIWGGLQADEDRFAFAPQRFDLIVSIGLLDSVNDVPGALVLMRRALKPGGLMLCAFAGAGSLSTLRGALRRIEPEMQRVHPMIDVRAGGDLLVRAGFQRAVGDVDDIKLYFADVATLVNTLRAYGATNCLAQRHHLRRATATRVRQALEQQGDITETLSIVTLTGWASAL